MAVGFYLKIISKILKKYEIIKIILSPEKNRKMRADSTKKQM
jgi:hypothetical protein